MTETRELNDIFADPFGEKQVVCVVSRDGADWLSATDGRLLLMQSLRRDLDFTFKGGEEWPAKVNNMLDMLKPDGNTHVMTLAALHEWAGPDPLLSVRQEPCQTCGGDGLCECPCCDTQHDCGYCKGTGKQMANREPDRVRVLWQVFDRGRLARLLAFAPQQDGSLRLSTARNATGCNDGSVRALLIEGDGWRGYLMGLEPHSEDNETPELPHAPPR